MDSQPQQGDGGTPGSLPRQLLQWWWMHPWAAVWLLPVAWMALLMAAGLLLGEALAPAARTVIGLVLSAGLAGLWGASCVRGVVLTWRKSTPRALVLVGVLTVGGAYLGSAVAPLIRAARTGPADLVVDDPGAAVRDARALIAAQAQDAARYTGWLRPEDVPPSLRVPNLNHVTVHGDHVDLVLARHPDGYAGGRIWAERHRPHADRTTPYPDIYFYRWDSDFPEAPDNIK